MTDTAYLDINTVSEHTKQWPEKTIIGLNLYPFAKAPRIKDLVRIVVSEACHLDGFLEDLDRELQFLGNTPASELETTLLVHPALFPDSKAFNQMLEIADDVVVENELEGIVQITPFHPDSQFKSTEADDISNYTSRPLHPTLYLTRESNIARTAETSPDASVIFNHSITLLEKMRHEDWDKLGIPRCPSLHHKSSENN